MVVLQEPVSVPDSTTTKGRKVKESLSYDGKSYPIPLAACSSQLPVPYPHRVAWDKLS